MVLDIDGDISLLTQALDWCTSCRRRWTFADEFVTGIGIISSDSSTDETELAASLGSEVRSPFHPLAKKNQKKSNKKLNDNTKNIPK